MRTPNADWDGSVTDTADGASRVQCLVPAGFVAGGVLLFAYPVGQTIFFGGVATIVEPANLFALGLTLVLSGAVALYGVRLNVSDVPPERYTRAGLWGAGGAAFLVGLNAPSILLLDSLSLPFRLGWAHYSILSGAAGGAIVGFHEARAIEKARTAERESMRAEFTKQQADRLDYLNSLLRHEVLNNANVIRGYARMARENPDEDVRDYLETIERQSADMTSVVEDVRILIEALQVEEVPEEVDLADLLTDELSALESRYESVDVEAAIPDTVFVRCDGLLPRVFRNLLSNAVEHNDSAEPRVAVDVEEGAETVTVGVADNGPGVPGPERETLFERSGRGDHGLGLYLVRVLVDRYGGTVELTETGADGSVFTVRLPRNRAASSPSNRSIPVPTEADVGGDEPSSGTAD